MLFDFDLPIPPATPVSSPVEQRVKLTHGTLVEIRVIFPPGPATLVYCVVRDRLHQIMPANTDGSLNFDDAVVTSRMEYSLTDPPYELLICGWSPKAVFAHTITFQFDLQPGEKDSWQEFIQHLFAGQAAQK